ncbi:MAG: InlB B-repeat-containing protein [bacterium]|nr:InlB B-repeat-containing protein [bacterium]
MSNMKMRSRLTALVLAVLMLISTAAPALAADALPLSVYQSMVDSAADQATSQPVINEGGTLTDAATYIPQQKDLPIYESTTVQELSVLPAGSETVVTVALPQKGKVQLSVGTDGGQWQAQMLGQWINVSGDNGAVCDVTYAKIKSLLDLNGEARFRWLSADGQSVSEMAVFTLTASTQTVVEDEPAAAGEQLAKRSSSPMMKTMSARDGEVAPTYNIAINYVFENNEVAADSYTGSLAAGSSFNTTVTFPTVMGYLPYVDDNQQDSYTFNITSMAEDVIITVVYKPTNVDYTVIHYQQNVENDEYTEVARETKQGLTNTTVPEVAKEYPGFYSLLYERPAIAADGSTVIEVYYDRYYYLMNFDMDGGYGSEPVYDRYGAAIGEVTEPTRAGYTFKGWAATENGTTAVDLPKTMPAENRTYYAIWEAAATANVTVVFWGENANDEEYSYLDEYTKVIQLQPGTEFTYSEEGMLKCDKEEHTHSDACRKCGQNEHTHSLENCYELTCTVTAHAHGVSCYDGVGRQSEAGLGAPNNPTNGTIARRAFSDAKVIYINGTWYRYSGSTAIGSVAPTNCGKESDHTHSIENNCYTLKCTETVHQHTTTCYCDKEEHSHDSSCYEQGAGVDNSLWKFVRSDTVTVKADGSSVINVYYDRVEKTLTFKYNYSNRAYQKTETITAKWGSDISDEYVAIANNANSTFWSAKTNGEGPYTNYFGVMPENNATYYNRGTNGGDGTMTYYGESLTGEYVKMFSVGGVGGYSVTDEDRYEFEGFTYDRGTANGSSCSGAEFYYTRNSYLLTFNDGYNIVKNESVKYEASLSTYKDYVPEVPAAYEPGSVVFAGWYLNPQCTGAEYKLAEHTMPAENVLLYAKWAPVDHTVTFYLDQTAWKAGSMLSSHEPVKVPHGSLMSPIPAEPDNGDYTFVGWFYEENGEEKAFDFAHMEVRKDLHVYGKWSSNTLKEYTVRFVLKSDETVKVAADIKGSALAGTTKTFDAKGDTELYADYQEGYFPDAKSKSLMMDIEADTLILTFYYTPAEAVPYTVKYVNKETGEALWEDKVVDDNRKAVVTETFVPITGYMPDAYQKRLVVTLGGENILYFYYTQDTQHAYYKITHFTQNTDLATWTEYSSSQFPGDIGQRYTADPLTINGYNYDHIEYVVGGVTVTDTDITNEGAVLTAAGLEINLYYVRKEYPYQVRYLEEGTGAQLAEPKDGREKYGKVVSESAIEIHGYTAIDPTSQTLNIRIEESVTEAKLNIITFYYKEKEATFNYIPVGPEGCGADGKPLATAAGTVDTETETVKVKTGLPVGSTATASSNVYKFVGWYLDAACTQSVPAEWVNGNKIVPQKQNLDDDESTAPLYESATYYAKFEYNLTSLTIVKDGYAETASIDPNQTFIFKVTGGDLGDGIMVSIDGDGSKTISGLTVGETYTVTEMESWSWRYDSDSSKSITLQPTGNTVTINNTREHIYWLDGNAVSVPNVYGN